MASVKEVATAAIMDTVRTDHRSEKAAIAVDDTDVKKQVIQEYDTDTGDEDAPKTKEDTNMNDTTTGNMSTGRTNDDETRTNHNDSDAAFDAIIQYIQNHVEIGPMLQKYLSTEQQLQLYGLYKQSRSVSTGTEESTDSDSTASLSSWWTTRSYRDRTKRQAYDAVRRHYTPVQAKQVYVQKLRQWTTGIADPDLQALHEFILHPTSTTTTTTTTTTAAAAAAAGSGGDTTQHSNHHHHHPDTALPSSHPFKVVQQRYDPPTDPQPSLGSTTDHWDHHHYQNSTHPTGDGPLTTLLLSNLLGISPLQARGTLDISYSDLCFGLLQCVPTIWPSRRSCWYQTVDSEIQQRWIQALPDRQKPPPPLSSASASTGSKTPLPRSSVHGRPVDQVMVGLSVRSLLDLYLQVKQYPPHSEIILSPPISVPGMMNVLQHHQIHCVGVDIPSPSITDTNNKHCDDDDDNDDNVAVVSIDLDGIQKAMTSNTVAVMIVHVFGMVVASNDDMQQLRSMVNRHNNNNNHVTSKAGVVDILEDCAECFTGLYHSDGTAPYLGSPYADLSFFSFGMIKNMTSIHGGIAVMGNFVTASARRHHRTGLIESMKRLQNSYCNEQSSLKYLQQVGKCILLKWIAQSPLVYGLMDSIVSGLGWNFDSLVKVLVRGFPMDRKQMMNRIRQRPSLAMLALLRRRLHQPSSSYIIQRIKFGRTLTDQIKNERKNGMNRLRTVAPKKDCESYYWLYPILVNDRVAVTKHLRQCGIDVTSGISQLCCVSSPKTCPNANAMMDSILYVPIDSGAAPGTYLRTNADDNDNKSVELLRSLKSATNGSAHTDTPLVSSDLRIDHSRKRRIVQHSVAFLLVIYFWSFVSIAIICLLQCIAILTTIYAIFIWLLRIEMGRFYVESSKGFAKYNYLLDGALGKSQATNRISNSSFGIISRMESLQVPIAVSDAKKRSVLLTGATGFVGSMLLRDLLFHRKELHIETVVVLCRSKKGKTATERVESLLDDIMFSFLSDVEKQSMVNVIEGDIILPRAGLSDETINCLVQRTCMTHIFNCAASVSFTQSLPEAATANILSALNLQCLGASISKEKVQFVHMSTAFVHGGRFGKNGEPLLENLFSLGQFDPIKIYSSMSGTQFYASKAMNELSFPNTYTFSKCIAEHLLLTIDPSTIIIRPSIIGPAVELPYEGWAGRTPSTIVAAACLYLGYQWNIWSFGRHLVPIIPIDVVSRFVIGKAFCTNRFENNEMCFVDESSSDESYEKISHGPSSRRTSPTLSFDREGRYQIFNAAWDETSSRCSGFTWFEYAGAVTQVGCVRGYFSRPTAYLGLLFATRLIPRMKLTTQRFATIHDWCVKLPFDWMTQIRKKFGFSTSQMKRLYAYLNLPLLFYPFMNNSYHFHSELVAPSELSGEHYLMMCVSAAHKFIQKSRINQSQENQQIDQTHWSLLTNAASNGSIRDPGILWAIAQPYGNILVRITAWLLVHVLKRCFAEISVDIQSFAPALHAHKETGTSCTILVPTHRSIVDSFILSLICFSIPELQIMLPSVAAADLFERIPLFGCLLHILGAFFVRRGRMSVDPNLMDHVSNVKAKSLHSVVELFIEGTRSRDRRFGQPKTGVLRCLYDPSGQQTIVPIVINYERLAEQGSLVTEASGGVPSALQLPAMISWLFNVFSGGITLGRVHVVACDPISFDDTTGLDVHDVVNEIQRRQAKSIFVSEYHVVASSHLLCVKPDVVQRAFDVIGAKAFPLCPRTDSQLSVSLNSSENLSILLQVSPLLAPLFTSSHPKWSNWLWADHDNDTVACGVDVLTNPHVAELVRSLCAMFDKADRLVEAAAKSLNALGFVHPRQQHVLQTALRDNDDVPTLLLLASIEGTIRDHKTTSKMGNIGSVMSIARRPKVGSEESLGYWGFSESQFVLQMDSDGSTYVRMDGNHYSLRGKKISGLLSFMERETATFVDLFNDAFTETSDDIKAIPSQIQGTALESLKLAVRNVSQTIEDRIRHGTGHSQEDIFLIRAKGVFRVPDVVVRPSSVSEVESLITLAKINEWCVIPFGGGTNVSNALRCPSYELEPRPIVSLDMRDLCRILWIDEENEIAHIEAGITGRHLEQALAIRGYTMGHEPDSIEFSTLGGWIATKASGMKRNKYGNIEDIVKSVCVIGPDGVLKHGSDDKRHVWGRESCGIDLRNLVLGSEGCMGVITSASIRICRTAESKDYDSILFYNFQAGLRFVRDVARLGSDCPASVRLLDNEHFRLGQALRPNSNSMVASFTNYCFGAFVKWKGNFDTKTMVCVTLIYESNATEVRRQKRAVHRISERHCGVRLGSDAGRASYELTFMIAYIRDFALSYYFLGESIETFAPWSQLETVVAETKKVVRHEHEKRCLPGKPFIGCRVTQLYHEGACVYFYFCMNFAGVQDASSVYSQIEHAARAAILANGGSLSHHHGIGKLRSSFLPTVDSDSFRGVVRKLKHAFDPGNIFGARNGGFSD